MAWFGEHHMASDGTKYPPTVSPKSKSMLLLEAILRDLTRGENYTFFIINVWNDPGWHNILCSQCIRIGCFTQYWNVLNRGFLYNTIYSMSFTEIPVGLKQK